MRRLNHEWYVEAERQIFALKFWIPEFRCGATLHLSELSVMHHTSKEKK